MTAISSGNNRNATGTTAQKIDKNQIKKAIEALLQHHEKQSLETPNNLLGNDTNIHLQFGLGKSASTTPQFNPKRVSIPHSLYKLKEDDTTDGSDSNSSLEEASICIFVKDEKSKKFVQEIKEELSSKSKHLQHITKVIHLQKLRKNYNQYSQRMELVNSFDMFFVDDRILPSVGSCLGKIFYKKKKQPIPIRLQWELPLYIKECLTSTYMVLPVGLCVSIRAGRTNMPSEHTIENCASIITNAVSKIPNQWSNIQNIHVKLTNSIALPIYKATLDLSVDEPKQSITKKDETVEEKTKSNEDKSKNNPILKALHQMKEDSSAVTTTTTVKRKKTQEDNATPDGKNKKKEENEIVKKQKADSGKKEKAKVNANSAEKKKKRRRKS